ncbi:GPI mannosyltransferase 2 [Rhizoctonia solani]|nr:GPI mannosyltransferase 2 [Rhizoctonia solani]
MQRPFSEFRLRIYFFIGTLLCHALAPLLPAFDTSHLVPLNPIPDYPDPTTSPLYANHGRLSGEFSSHLPKLVPSLGMRWDTLHFLDVALYGTYAYEHQYAFSLGVPIILRLVHLGKELLFSLSIPQSSQGSVNIILRGWLGGLINTLLVAMLATQPCLALYRLTEKITHSEEFSYLSLVVYIVMGAPPVIIRSAYAEPFFAWFTFEGLSAYHERRYISASLYFGLATAFRTNGILLPFFILYGLLVHPILVELFATLSNSAGFRLTDISTHLYWATKKLRPSMIIYGALLTIICLSPFFTQQYIAYLTFCQPLNPRPWCNFRIPLVYSFVQSHYWNIGLWRYWTVAQIPNFLLAMPMLTLAFSSVILFIVASSRGIQFAKHKKVDSPLLDQILRPSAILVLLPYALHALALSVILLTAGHVQIALRVLPAATPWVSWAGAALIVQGTRCRGDTEQNISSRTDSPGRSWWTFLSHIWIGWSVVWLFVSSILWLAFLPPA